MKEGLNLIEIYVVVSLFGMVYFNDLHTYDFDFVWKKIVRYEHHFENYKRSLQTDITPFGL